MTMKKITFLIITMLLPLIAMADAVEVDGIYYNLISKGNVAEVTNNPSQYKGSISIPSTISYKGVDYTVTAISAGAFAGYKELTSITIPNSVTSIGVQAFFYCQGLTSITIPNSVTSIGSSAFSHCTSLTSITIPNSVTSIDDMAFSNCTSLTSITIPNSVTSIGVQAFFNCQGLTSITIPNSVTSIGSSAFNNCTSLTSITIPNSVTSIGSTAFNNCTSLTSITIPNSVTIIESGVFSGCTSLTSISIPSGVTIIRSYAFGSCQILTDVYCYAEEVPSTAADSFKDSYIDYVTLHVPDASVSAYSNAEPWKNFKSIVGIGGGTVSKCEKPSISYQNGQLKMSCSTEGVEYVTDIVDADVKKHYDATISLTATYNISVYATKAGYINSDVATATLCWIDQEPTKEGIVDGIVNVPSRAIMISSDGGLLTINGAEDGTLIEVYKLDGTQAGASESKNGSARIYTNLQPGNIAIVKTGKKSVKVVIR